MRNGHAAEGVCWGLTRTLKMKVDGLANGSSSSAREKNEGRRRRIYHVDGEITIFPDLMSASHLVSQIGSHINTDLSVSLG